MVRHCFIYLNAAFFYLQTLIMYVDLCSKSNMDPNGLSHRSFQISDAASEEDFSYLNCRQTAQLPISFRAAALVTPLQLGTKPTKHRNERRIEKLSHEVPNFIGCVSHIRINKKVGRIYSIIDYYYNYLIEWMYRNISGHSFKTSGHLLLAKEVILDVTTSGVKDTSPCVLLTQSM